MDIITAFNSRAAQIDHDLRISGVEGEAGANVTVLALTRHGVHQPQISILVDDLDATRTAQVICSMEQSAICDGLVVYATLIDAISGRTGKDASWRNGILQRLHLFDGGIATGKLQQTSARGMRYSVRVNDPALGLMTYTVNRNRS